MKGLLYKDLIVQKVNLICIGIVIFLLPMPLWIMANDEYQDEGLAAMLMCSGTYCIIFFIIGMFQSAMFEHDETKKWSGYITSSPIATEGQVASKYLMSLIISIIALFWCYIVGIICETIFEGMTSPFSLCVGLFYFQLFMRAVEFPFVARFGCKSGAAIKGAVFVLIILAAAVYGLFGDISFIGSFDSVMDKLISILSGDGISSYAMLILSLLPFICIALYYASYRISCRLYLKGIESYEK